MQVKDFAQEQAWLDAVYKEIDEQLAQQEKRTLTYRDELIELRTSLWEDHGISTASANRLMDVAQQISELQHSTGHFINQRSLLQKLDALEQTPYFGRIDFHEDGLPTVEALYIGIRSLFDQKTNLPLIYDWRAPISSMFYDFGLGEAHYEGPGGFYRGAISLKRQYRIKDRNLVYMFENELKIDDEVLQEALGQHGTERMRTIVNTIQREQNQAIRNDQDSLLLVEGPAGSGKTSVALHRVAYLLYRYREIIGSKNIVVFSPSRIFNDYISYVLPELGEENVHQTTFLDFAEPFLGWNWDVESLVVGLEALFLEDAESRKLCLQTMSFKSSREFQTILDRLVGGVTEVASSFQDIHVGSQLIISQAEQQKLFSENYSYLPIHKRLRKIYQRILFLLRPIKKKRMQRILQELSRSDTFEDESWLTMAREAVRLTREEFEPILNQTSSELQVDSMAWYQRLWQDASLWDSLAFGVARPKTNALSLEGLGQNKVSFEDVVPLLYLKGELEGYPVKREILHVVVDEVQDYSPLQLAILQRTFPRAKFTLVGDLNQSLNPYIWQKGLTRLEEVFSELEPKSIRLTKSYRSTEEIFYFCNALLEKPPVGETVLRQGPKPSLVKVKRGKRPDAVVTRIRQSIAGNYKTIAVILPTVSECALLHSELTELAPDLAISLLTDEKACFKRGVIVVPVSLGKGLEFDVVIVPEVGEEAYHEEYSRRLLYVACSRALHELHLFYTGKLTQFLSQVARELYTIVAVT